MFVGQTGGDVKQPGVPWGGPEGVLGGSPEGVLGGSWGVSRCLHHIRFQGLISASLKQPDWKPREVFTFGVLKTEKSEQSLVGSGSARTLAFFWNFQSLISLLRTVSLCKNKPQTEAGNVQK